MTTLREKVRDLVGQWKYQGRGYDVNSPFSDHELNHLVERIESALVAERERAIQECAEIANKWEHEWFDYHSVPTHLAKELGLIEEEIRSLLDTSRVSCSGQDDGPRIN